MTLTNVFGRAVEVGVPREPLGRPLPLRTDDDTDEELDILLSLMDTEIRRNQLEYEK